MATVESYSRMLWPFFAARSLTPDRVKPTDVLAWVHGIGKSGRTPSSTTTGARIACLISYYRFLIRMGLVVGYGRTWLRIHHGHARPLGGNSAGPIAIDRARLDRQFHDAVTSSPPDSHRPQTSTVWRSRCQRLLWRARRDSNPRPSDPKSSSRQSEQRESIRAWNGHREDAVLVDSGVSLDPAPERVWCPSRKPERVRCPRRD